MTLRQYNLAFSSKDARESALTRTLAPSLIEAEDAGALQLWWFLRKPSLTSDGETAGLRLRVDVADPAPLEELLGRLAAEGTISAIATSVYEPETTAFGGQEAMDIAHELFHSDSRHLLTLPRPGLGPKETSVLLCSAMLRAAALDWHEQGDVWVKVAELRQALAGRIEDEPLAAMRILLTVDPRPLTEREQPLHGQGAWIEAFEKAGQALDRLNRTGRLTRGLRAVLACHIVFHLNRAAVPGKDQAMIATTALHTIFNSDLTPVSGPALTLAAPNLAEVTTLTSGKDAAHLRQALTDRLSIADPAVQDAFQAVPRHLFVPGSDLEAAYADNAVYTKTDASGAQISAASQPRIVAMMLDQLGAGPGEKILEAGAGTGYNAALMGHIVGPRGRVVTIDVDEDLVDAARSHLEAAHATNVKVVLGDGVLGHAAEAPYDRFIATVGAWDVPEAWTAQLGPSARMVVPLRLAGVSSRSIAFDRGEDGWRSVGSELATFMPLRGIGDDARRVIALTGQHDATLQVHKDQHADPDLLAGVLAADKSDMWTGVEFGTSESFEWLELWLSLTLPNPLMRMVVQPSAKERDGIVTAFGYGSTATADQGTLAYLTFRRLRDKVIEVGVAGHGPARGDLAAQVADHIQTWQSRYRGAVPTFTLPDGDPGRSDVNEGRFVLDRPQHPIVVTW